MGGGILARCALVRGKPGLPGHYLYLTTKGIRRTKDAGRGVHRLSEEGL